MVKSMKWLSAATAVAFVLSASNAFAADAGDVSKCNKTIEKIQVGVQKAVAAGLDKCMQGAMKEISADNAVKCEATLQKSEATKTKNKDKCLASCAGDDAAATKDIIASAGHLVSTVNAPGTNPMDFVCTMAVLRGEDLGNQQALSAWTNAGKLIEELAKAGGSGTPTLAKYASTVSPTCKTHVCSLNDDAGATEVTLVHGLGSLAVPMSGSIPMQFCPLPATGLPLNNNTLLVTGGAAKMGVVDVMGTTICVGALDIEGWCQCAGAGVPFNYTMCQDHIAAGGGAADDCGGTATSVDTYHSGVLNGLPVTTFSGTSSPGDCLVTLVTSFAISLGAGVDSTPCTPDDVYSPLTPQGIPSTTGTAQGAIKDGNNTEGADITGPTITGAQAFCADLMSSNASGLAVVGAVPSPDGLYGILGDIIIDAKLVCR